MAIFTGTDGNDLLQGGNQNDLLLGLDGNDTLDGGVGLNTLEGGTGDDAFMVHSLTDTAVEDPGEGTDIVYWAGLGAYQLPDNIEDLTLQGNATEGTGNALDNTIFANIDVDSGLSVTLDGRAGDDNIWGGANDDAIQGGDGDDWLDGGGGGDIIHGGAGNDYVVGESFSFGAGWNDTLFGDAGDDLLEGLDGDDVLEGGDGADILHGYAGDDVMNGGAGTDWFQVDVGTNGFDHDMVKDFTDGEDRILLALDGLTAPDMSSVQSTAQSGNSTAITFSSGGEMRLDNVSADAITSDDFLFYQDGSFASETLSGGAFSDMLSGGAGNDQLLSAASSDLVLGGDGQDRLRAGSGDDVLNGGTDRDTSKGGFGADAFQFGSLADTGDTIFDYDAAQGDVVDLSEIDANPSRTGDQAFRFVPAFDGRACEAVLTYDVGHDRTVLQLDATGDSRADFVLRLDGYVTADAGWVL
jgi:Ca2+-binding RTX toxin-like protein